MGDLWVGAWLLFAWPFGDVDVAATLGNRDTICSVQHAYDRRVLLLSYYYYYYYLLGTDLFGISLAFAWISKE